MNSSNYLINSTYNSNYLNSLPHGAGRALSRKKAVIKTENINTENIVLPLDFQEIVNQGRKDLVDILAKRIKEESSNAYKDINLTNEILQKLKVANPAFELKPLITLKGF